MATPSTSLIRWLRVQDRRLRMRTTFTEIPVLVALSLHLLPLTVAAVIWPIEVPLGVVLLPMVAASQLLGPRTLPWFVLACLAALIVMILAMPAIDTAEMFRILIMFTLGLLILVVSFRRSRLGIAGLRGESILVDLRDRITAMSRIPRLPKGWAADVHLQAAGGTQFGGDFVVAGARSNHELDVVVADVTGKGIRAATRSLLLSGAMGSLLYALPRAEFLPAANDYLLRREWVDGFATAVHVYVDLETGHFEVRTAGHPPAIWLDAGSGRWSQVQSDGIALGLAERQVYAFAAGTLRKGDALVVYTDGVVEGPDQELSRGIDRLAGRAQVLHQRGGAIPAKSLVQQSRRTEDDQAAVVIQRL